MEVKEKIFNIISEQLGISANEISMGSSLYGELGMSSLDIVDIGMSLEDEFLIELPDAIPKNLNTVEDIVRLAESLLENRARFKKIIF